MEKFLKNPKMHHVLLHKDDLNEEQLKAIKDHVEKNLDPQVNEAANELLSAVGKMIHEYNDKHGMHVIGLFVHQLDETHTEGAIEGYHDINHEDVPGLNPMH